MTNGCWARCIGKVIKCSACDEPIPKSARYWYFRQYVSGAMVHKRFCEACHARGLALHVLPASEIGTFKKWAKKPGQFIPLEEQLADKDRTWLMPGEFKAIAANVEGGNDG